MKHNTYTRPLLCITAGLCVSGYGEAADNRDETRKDTLIVNVRPSHKPLQGVQHEIGVRSNGSWTIVQGRKRAVTLGVEFGF
ncbi:hypothetical protein RCF98_06340 [Thiothrix lacustris]|uniref:Porin domain-containing protein n=1 Tax=Thiothrix lacustris TaxID=525917 RepID=A0ABY9MWI4_9GAMM|nr:hypothetical protein [Thiothrix lacustris]WML91955.1 hypothetical protein RCF98_06340 [Thiothrix lacustris]